MKPSIRDTPTWPEILDELSWITTKDIAAYLGVTERAVRNWKNMGDAPRSAILALYFHTHYGRDALATEAHHEIKHFYRRAIAAELEIDRLRQEIARLHTVICKLESEAKWQSSNGPVYKTL